MTPVELVLSRLEGTRPTSNGWEAKCPAHDDDTPSLDIAEGDDGRALVDCKAHCSAESVLEAIHLKMRDLFPRNNGGNSLGVEIESYTYTDANGKRLFEVVRFNPKTFRQRLPDGRWGLHGVEPVLYRLPKVIESANSSGTIFVVEGERDVHTLEGLGATATTNPGGAGKWRKSYSESLRGANVAILPDNDDAGMRHAERVARSLHGVANAIKIVTLPGLRPKGDVSDWLQDHDAEELTELVKTTPMWDAPKPSEALVDGHPSDVPNDDDPISPTSDMANIKRFVDQHGTTSRWLTEKNRLVRYSRESGRWMFKGAFDLWQLTVKSIYTEASVEPDPERRKQLGAWARQCESTKRYRELVTGLQHLPDFNISVDAFDRDPFILNARNCALDLKSGRVEAREHRPDDYCFLQLGCDYDAHAVPVTFLTALNRSLPDEDIRRAFQVIMGQALIAKPIQKLPFITGIGNNGKTTFAEAISSVFGSYAKTIDAASLAESRRKGSDASPDIARLIGTRLAMVNDPKKGHHLAEGLIKNLTGGDTLPARFLYARDIFEFIFQGTVIVRCNHLPRFDGADYAMARRMLVVPFNVIIPNEERDEELRTKLREERSGILNWLLEGAIDYLDAGLRLPKAVEVATSAYIEQHDPVGRFEKQCLSFDAEGIIANGELEAAWHEWFENEEGKIERAPKGVPRTIRTLKDELKRRHPEIDLTYREKNMRGIKGISLRSE